MKPTATSIEPRDSMGIDLIVAWLRRIGFDVKVATPGHQGPQGWESSQIYLHVAREHLAVDPDRLRTALRAMGYGAHPGTVTATYDPSNREADLLLMGVNNHQLPASVAAQAAQRLDKETT